MPSYVVYESSSDWSGLYEDGKLIYVGDHYIVDEKIREIFKITTIQSDDFFLGKENVQYNDVAQTLEELEAFTRSRQEKEDIAEQLREQARGLLARADEISGKTVA